MFEEAGVNPATELQTHCTLPAKHQTEDRQSLQLAGEDSSQSDISLEAKRRVNVGIRK